MNRVKSFFLISFALIHCILSGQQVVVNAYFNAADPRDEWIELLVINDNTDMRNWSIRDNNSSQTGWQTAVSFNSVALWNNLRSGTVIMIWNRVITSGGVAHPLDVNKNDGYIELDASNTTYFNGGAFGTSPSWSGNSLNFAGGGDVIQLLNGSGTHVHALGHCSPAGSNWNALPAPKLNHANTANSGDAIYVCPGASISDYDGPASGNNFTSKNNGTITFGLPNTCGASATGNTTYWKALREPVIAAQTVTPSVSVPGDITFSWTAATDPNSSDNTIGYMILRNTTNTFTAPTDGTTYPVTGTIGSATVVAEITSSTTTTYTDNTVTAGNCYFYRVYAFRYGTDNPNGNSFDQSRGRAYNQTNFVFINCLTVLPIELLNFSVSDLDQKVKIDWTTATEHNNDRFIIERSIDARDFEELVSVKGAGNSTELNYYSALDDRPFEGTSYYRLKQIDFDGMISYSKTEVITKEKRTIENIYPNPVRDQLNITLGHSFESDLNIVVLNLQGETVFKKEMHLKEGELNISIDISSLDNGTYILKLENGHSTSRNIVLKTN